MPSVIAAKPGVKKAAEIPQTTCAATIAGKFTKKVIQTHAAAIPKEDTAMINRLYRV